MRKWQQGDRFKPLGMKGEKLISDFLIDHKVPQTAKENCFVLADHTGTIMWLIGWRISNTYAITEQTKNVLKIIYKPI